MDTYTISTSLDIDGDIIDLEFSKGQFDDWVDIALNVPLENEMSPKEVRGLWENRRACVWVLRTPSGHFLAGVRFARKQGGWRITHDAVVDSSASDAILAHLIKLAHQRITYGKGDLFMWLPESSLDRPLLKLLAEQGFRSKMDPTGSYIVMAKPIELEDEEIEDGAGRRS